MIFNSWILLQELVTLKRSVLVGGGGLAAVLGSQLVGYSGAGPLTCITASFTASLCWKLQGWSSNHVRMNSICLFSGFSHIQFYIILYMFPHAEKMWTAWINIIHSNLHTIKFKNQPKILLSRGILYIEVTRNPSLFFC